MVETQTGRRRRVALIAIGTLAFSAPTGFTQTAHAPAQMGMPASGSAVVPIGSGSSCIKLSVIMNVVGLELRFEGIPPRQTFYFHGAKISAFPEAIRLSMSTSANCTEDPLFPSFVWPEFAEHLHYSFAWSIGGETNQPHLVAVKPTQKEAIAPPWKEGSSSKELWFTIPAKGIPIGSRLNIGVFSGEKLLKSFSIQLGRSFQS